MKEVKFKEVKTVDYVVKKVNFDELYELVKERTPGFNLTPYGLLMRLSEEILLAPTREMRFHFVEEGGEAIMAVVSCVEIAEKLKEHGEKIIKTCREHGK